jgi:nucleoside-diphosphate-sugar epimerase
MDDAGTLTGKSVLVTGAGCLGSRLVPRIAEEGAKAIRLFDRAQDRVAALAETAEPVVGDITDPAQVQAAVEGVDIVVHTAALLDGEPEAYYHVNVTGTRTLAEAAAAAGVERFVHVSSNAVYGFPTSDVSEDDGPNPTKQAYSRSKAMGEQAVGAVAAGTGMDHAVIRPAAIFGPGAEYFTGAYMRRAMKKPIIFIGRGRGALAVVFVDDVADLAVVAATHPAAVGEAFNCAIDPPPTHREYLHAYGRLIGNSSYLGLPMPVVRAGSWLAVPFAKAETYSRQLPQNLRQIDRYVRYRMDKARELLGWVPTYDLESGIEASIPWLQEKGILNHRLG